MSVIEKIKTITVNEAENIFKNYKYYLIYMISEVKFGKTEEIAQLNLAEIQEAFFFDEKGQIHIYFDEGSVEVRLFNDEDLSFVHQVSKKYELKNRFFVDGHKTVLVKEYLDFDEDGQSYVAYTRLVGLE